MSIFNELLPKINEISNTFTKNFNYDLKAIYECFDKFEEEYQNGRGRGAREKAQKDKNLMTTLQSINEDEDETNKISVTVNSTDKSNAETISIGSADSNDEKPRRMSKKRSKNEMDGVLSPEQDKRQKRNALVKAQSIITKQVNVNLTQKLRRDGSLEKSQSKGRKKKDDDENKENTPPRTQIQIKEEKMSLPPEPMDMEALPLNIEVKQEPKKDEIAMPPPMAPVPKPRKGAAKDKPDEATEEEPKSRRSTRTRKQTEAAPVAAHRSTRGSSRAPKQTEEELPPPEPRPKRTRAKKKVSESLSIQCDKETTQPAPDSATASPAEKPRPKRTRRGKAAEKEPPKPEIPEPVPLKSERIFVPEAPQSPILQPKENTKSNLTKQVLKSKVDDTVHTIDDSKTQTNIQMDETRVIINRISVNGNNNIEMDKTVVLPNGVYNHSQHRNMNETVVLDTCNRETMVIEKQHVIMDATVVIEKAPEQKMSTNLTDDNSIMTDDNDEPRSPPKQEPPKIQPTSAVKEKVQQFEELASRVTRTKTRAMAKKEEPEENQTPPDKTSKPILSAETLNKMNSLIFNGKAPQISSSASKPRTNIVTSVKSMISTSTSKLSAIAKAKEAAEESLKLEKEDARKKKEAMLEAKREQQRRKREEKMAAAAAAREAAERERKAAMEAAARERMEKQAHADMGKQSRLKEVERKKQELARKVAETEERRKAEEQARQQRLADEQRRADLARRKQLDEAEAMKKEALIMKEIEKKQKEYKEKQKIMKHRLDMDMHTFPKTPGTPGGYPMEPVYMADGFQYLNSDEDEEPADIPVPSWSTTKARKTFLCVQSLISAQHIDRLFSVRAHTPDLRGIFPNIERARLKRTSSAVWRTPPALRPVPE